MPVPSTESRTPPKIMTTRLDRPRADEAPCISCASGSSLHVYGEDPDGFVLCRECGALLFYCDVGGQG